MPRVLLVVVAFAAAATALPHRLRRAKPEKSVADDHAHRLRGAASAVKEVAHDRPPRGVAPSLAALEADLDHLLEHSVLNSERRVVALIAVGIEAAVEALVKFVAKKCVNGVAAKVKNMFNRGGKDENGQVTPVGTAELSLARACVQLRAHQIKGEEIGWSAEDLKAELTVLGVHTLEGERGEIDFDPRGTKINYIDPHGTPRQTTFNEGEDDLENQKNAYATARTALAEAMTQAVVEASKVDGTNAVDKAGKPLNVADVREGASQIKVGDGTTTGPD